MKRIGAESRHRVGLTLNGREAGGWAEPRMLLSDFLAATSLGATGTHVGCEPRGLRCLHGTPRRRPGARPA